MTLTAEAVPLQVLRLEVVRAGLDALRGQRIHEHFPAYLHLRQRAIADGTFTDIKPTWRDVKDLLSVPGGPPTKPHYRPFSSRHVQDPSVYWYNPNLAGSYAPKSIRSTSRFMLNSADAYVLPEDHAQQALTVLLRGNRVPAWALAAFYLRNYGFPVAGGSDAEALVRAFRQRFLFNDDHTDFDTLFDDGVPATPDGAWFEPFVPEAAEEGTFDA